MANPVNNVEVSAKANFGNVLEVNPKIGGTIKIPDIQSTKIFGNVTENLGKNPNHAPTSQHAADANAATPTNPNINSENHAGDPPARNNQPNDNQDNTQQRAGDIRKENANVQINQGQKGGLHAFDLGVENVQGHIKVQNQGHGQTNPTTNFPQDRIEHPNEQFEYKPLLTARDGKVPNWGEHFSVEYNLRANGNQPEGLIHRVVDQVLRRYDIYLNNESVKRLFNNQTSTQMPREIDDLVRNIGNRVLSMLNNTSRNDLMIHEISKKISQQMQENIQNSKALWLRREDLSATRFQQLNISQRMNAAVELLPRHLPSKILENLQHYKSNAILNGLLIARGLIAPGEHSADVRNFIAFRSSVLPNGVSLMNLRDVGQLVKILISDTAAAKSTAYLDLAVQKFVRLMIANNELGVLLATVDLASQSMNRGGLMSRSLALVQIYELIDMMRLAGEKALREAMPEKSPNDFLLKEKNALQNVNHSTLDETDNLKAPINKQQGAETVLRQYLEFNPAFIYDNSASVFNNPEDSRRAQQDFVNLYHSDIEQWLSSGNHRFVKDHDFVKPLGVVVERNNDGVFTANTARFVLVRDGSAAGWHFLKSFLVK